MSTQRSLFTELSRYTGVGVDTRAENAFVVASKFMLLMRDEIKDDRAFDLMMKAWFRAVKDNDFSKFKRTFQKYQSTDQGPPKST